jgi:hypothetical protein
LNNILATACEIAKIITKRQIPSHTDVRFHSAIFNLGTRRKFVFVTIQTDSLGKGKVDPVLFLTEHHAVKAYWGSGGIAPGILVFGTRWR